MTKSTTTTLNFTVASHSTRAVSDRATWNAKLRRLSIPSKYSKGVKFYSPLGAEGGADALMLTPSDSGCAVHPSQRFITVPVDLASALVSRRYSIAEDSGVLTLTPAD